jgi:RNA polymerase sigma-70 factor (ECF subfamily)
LERLFLQVLRCQAGDEEAFAALHETFSGRTKRYLRGVLGDALADDVQQDVWFTVYRRIAELENPAGFRTWLYRVTRHRAIDALRRERRRPDLLAESPDDLDTRVSGDDSPLDRDAFEPLLERLSESHREVLVLRFWEDMSYGDIALVVGCSVGTIRSRLHHAKAQVRGMLEQGQG